MAGPFRPYDGRFGLGTTLVLAAVFVFGSIAAYLGTLWWLLVSLLVAPFLIYRISRIHKNPQRRFYHHFVMVFWGHLGSEVAQAKQEGREPHGPSAALRAIQTLFPQEDPAALILLMAESIGRLDDENDRDNLAAILLAKTPTPTNTYEACRSGLDKFIEQNRTACITRWIAGEAVEKRWGPAARLDLLSDIVLARLTEPEGKA